MSYFLFLVHHRKIRYTHTMFGKNHRINSRDYTGIFKKGTKIHRDSFFVVYQNDELPVRYAVSVPKKKAKRAVDRVRIRRQVYGALKRGATPKTGAYIVVIKNLPIDVDQITETINTI